MRLGFAFAVFKLFPLVQSKGGSKRLPVVLLLHFTVLAKETCRRKHKQPMLGMLLVLQVLW